MSAHHPDTIIFNSGWFRKDIPIVGLPEPCCILVDKPGTISDKLPNIFIQVEPEIIYRNEAYLIKHAHHYHTILTFNSNVLAACKNARQYVYGTTWIPREIYDNVDTTLKEFRISMLAGGKRINNAPGHIFRQVLHHSQAALKDFPITFYRSSRQAPIQDYGGNPLLGHDGKRTILLKR